MPQETKVKNRENCKNRTHQSFWPLWISVFRTLYIYVFFCHYHVLKQIPESSYFHAVRLTRLGLAVLVALHFCLVRYSPQLKSCKSCRQQLYVTQIFLSPFFSIFLHSGIKKSVLICSFCSFLCSFLLSILFIPLFFSTLLLVPCSVLSFSVYSLYFLISLIVFFSNLQSFSFPSFPITLFCLFLLYVLLLFNVVSFCYSSSF